MLKKLSFVLLPGSRLPAIYYCNPAAFSKFSFEGSVIQLSSSLSVYSDFSQKIKE
jgi:hypothetical protein